MSKRNKEENRRNDLDYHIGKFLNHSQKTYLLNKIPNGFYYVDLFSNYCIKQSSPSFQYIHIIMTMTDRVYCVRCNNEKPFLHRICTICA